VASSNVSLTVRWFVYIDNKVYGPYSPEQLSPFLRPETLVTRAGAEQWISATQDPLLKDVLDGKISARLEWYVTRAGKPERGPLGHDALIAMIERHELELRDLIRHESWKESVALGQSRLYAKWKDPAMDLDELSPSLVTHSPRHIAPDSPAPPTSKIARARAALPRGGGWILGAAIAAIVAYGGYLASQPSTLPSGSPQGVPAVQACGGPASSECDHDSVSRCICKDVPAYCGCAEKGSCGMPSCEAYVKNRDLGPPPVESR
jgi:hypothetical protein